MKVYKLTDENGCTRNHTQWGENMLHTSPGTGELCSAGWLHAYTSQYLALFLNPMHANIRNPRLWEAEGSGAMKSDKGLKVGFSTLITIREIPVIQPTTDQRIAFAILCALKVCTEPSFVKWGKDWLNGADRSCDAAAHAAADAAHAAAHAAYAAAFAANAAADAANDAAHAAYAAASAAAFAASAATYAAASAASAAAFAAFAAYADCELIDLITIAEEAMEY